MYAIAPLWLVGKNEPLSLLSSTAGSEPGLQMNAGARHPYFTFSLAAEEDEVITTLEQQRGSELQERSSK